MVKEEYVKDKEEQDKNTDDQVNDKGKKVRVSNKQKKHWAENEDMEFKYLFNFSMVSSSLRMVKALNYFRRGNRRPSLQLLEHPRNSPTSPPLKEAVSINKVGNETFIL